MAPSAISIPDPTFSSCSATYFNAFAAQTSPFDDAFYDGITCLSSTAPANLWEDGICGDGILSGDEECDTFGVTDDCCDAVRSGVVTMFVVKLNSTICRDLCFGFWWLAVPCRAVLCCDDIKATCMLKAGAVCSPDHHSCCTYVEYITAIEVQNI